MDDFSDSIRFSFIRKIADGGMGSVHEAIQHGVSGFEKRVAIKVLLPKFLDNQRAISMFIEEAKLVAGLVHENIVQIHQLGKQSEFHYIVMEYVQGLSLHEFIQDHIAKNSTIPEELAVFIASRIARGLAYAHSRTDSSGKNLGIIHRDVSPKNVLIRREGLPKLADFGLAVLSTADQATSKRSVAGKLSYMAPEQATGVAIDQRADVFGLGAILFELLALDRIRHGNDLEGILSIAAQGQINWDKLSGKASAALKNILEKCLAKNPAVRYESCALLARDLEYYIYKEGYGPTIGTLETYLRSYFPALY